MLIIIIKQVFIGLTVAGILAYLKYLHDRPVKLINKAKDEIYDFHKDSLLQTKKAIISKLSLEISEQLQTVNAEIISLKAIVAEIERCKDCK